MHIEVSRISNALSVKWYCALRVCAGHNYRNVNISNMLTLTNITASSLQMRMITVAVKAKPTMRISANIFSCFSQA